MYGRSNYIKNDGNRKNGKNNKKEVIRKAAIRVFAQEGYHKATTDRIAEEAGVAVGTIYNYFANKTGVLDYIFQVEYQKRKALFEELIKKDLSPPEKIRQIVEKHFAEVKAEPELVKIILEERPYTCMASRERAGLRKFFEVIIAEGVEKGTLREVDAEILATMLFGAVEAVMREYLAHSGGKPQQHQQRPDELPKEEKNLQNGEIEEDFTQEDNLRLFDRALEEIMKVLRQGMFRENKY